jgi:AraC-like DNA-binding protein
VTGWSGAALPHHPAGPDVCLALRGPLVAELARAAGARVIDLAAGAHARLVSDVAACARGQGDPLAVAEAVALLAGSDPADRAPVRRRDRELAGDLADALRLSFARPVELGELAAAVGSSVFHACRVFRRVTGTTLSGFRGELRLRHALAMLLDGDAPLADVAAQAGFASQSHLGNRFRARFGLTPGRVRARRSL